jgi:glucuronate isomerase
MKLHKRPPAVDLRASAERILARNDHDDADALFDLLTGAIDAEHFRNRTEIDDIVIEVFAATSYAHDARHVRREIIERYFKVEPNNA